ncbi:MAG: hypothetical protein ABJQ04_16135 [Roseibium sp.]
MWAIVIVIVAPSVFFKVVAAWHFVMLRDFRAGPWRRGQHYVVDLAPRMRTRRLFDYAAILISMSILAWEG